ncbi:pyridoxal phosphate-dependent transferase [Zopfochytrium polystomum]|nr:pyridoxal phosphate-dependent transferase [Zopfochytrium polystomum]
MYSGNAPPPTAAKYRFDFRSDTVTTPTAPMLEQMMAANVGDDVFQEDPTINKLQRYACELTGHEAALFCASATMSNQLAIRSLLGAPPHSVVCDKRAHVFQYEASGIAYHTGASVFAVDPKTGSSHLTLDVVEKACVLDDDVHHAPTKLVCLENTLHGEIFPIDEIRRISEFARKNGLKMHLDGARLWNASVATGISLREYCKEFDSVSLCLSKGLGAPVGSLLVGSHDLIKKARHFRKMFGGGWRQAGLLASAGLFAIEHHWTLLKQDHENAQILADSLVKLGFKLVHRRDTNMVFVDSTPLNLPIDELRDELAANGIRIFGGGVGVMRLVLHHQISREAVSEFIKITETVMSKRKGKKGWF